MTIMPCSECGKPELINYAYRGKCYCHECFRPIKEAVDEADEKYPRPLNGSDAVFYPSADAETRDVIVGWVMADLFLQIGRGDWAYAWLKCGFIHPKISDNFRETMGCRRAPLPTRLTKEEVKEWDRAVRDYKRMRNE